MGIFTEWLREDTRLIDFSGEARPRIKEALQKEFSAHQNEIAKELAQGFYNATRGGARQKQGLDTRWEFQISPIPISSEGKQYRLGSMLIAYQLPRENGEKRDSLNSEDLGKFLKEKTPVFLQLIKDTLLEDKVLNQLSNLVTARVFNATEDGNPNDEAKAKVIWERPVNGKKNRKSLGRIVIAHWIPEKGAIQNPQTAATGS